MGSEPDKQEFMLRQRRAEQQEGAQLKDLLTGVLTELDIDNSKTLSVVEFQSVCKVPEFRHFLEQRGIHIKEAGTFFSMIACFLRIKGMATTIDLHTLRFEMKSALRRQK